MTRISLIETVMHRSGGSLSNTHKNPYALRPFVIPIILCCFMLSSCSIGTKRLLCLIAPCVMTNTNKVEGKGADIAGQEQDKEKEEWNEDIFSDYILGPEDVVEISVWKNEALSRVVAIRPDGKISLPLIGDVQAAGLTASKLKETITKRLRVYQETPEVSVIIQQINSYIVYIAGEVVRPGKYPLKSRTTLLQGITLAGGFTQFASKNNILLLRKNGLKEIRFKIRYDDILSGKKGVVDPILFPGDRVVIP